MIKIKEYIHTINCECGQRIALKNNNDEILS